MRFLKKLLRCFVVWRVKYPEWSECDQRIAEALARGQKVVLLTHDIGLCKGNTPGRGNMRMARVLKDVQAAYDAPVLAQRGVALAAERIGVPITLVVESVIKAPRPLDRSTMSYNSQTIVVSQKKWLEKHGMWPVLALTLTTPFHMPRVQWIMEKEGFAYLLPIPLTSTRQWDYMDPDSLYLSVRIASRIPGGMLVSYSREILARLLSLAKGWM